MYPSPPSPATEDLQRLLRLRLSGRAPVRLALLQALFGHHDLDALDARQRRRLLALLESRDDSALEVLAWRGDAGRSRLSLQIDVLFDGEADATEQHGMAGQLLELLQAAPWSSATLVIRSIVVTAPAAE